MFSIYVSYIKDIEILVISCVYRWLYTNVCDISCISLVEDLLFVLKKKLLWFIKSSLHIFNVFFILNLVQTITTIKKILV